MASKKSSQAWSLQIQAFLNGELDDPHALSQADIQHFVDDGMARQQYTGIRLLVRKVSDFKGYIFADNAAWTERWGWVRDALAKHLLTFPFLNDDPGVRKLADCSEYPGQKETWAQMLAEAYWHLTEKLSEKGLHVYLGQLMNRLDQTDFSPQFFQGLRQKKALLQPESVIVMGGIQQVEMALDGTPDTRAIFFESRLYGKEPIEYAASYYCRSGQWSRLVVLSNHCQGGPKNYELDYRMNKALGAAIYSAFLLKDSRHVSNEATPKDFKEFLAAPKFLKESEKMMPDAAQEERWHDRLRGAVALVDNAVQSNPNTAKNFREWCKLNPPFGDMLGEVLRNDVLKRVQRYVFAAS